MPESFAQLDEHARQVMRNASGNAHSLGHPRLEPEHILLGILDEGSGVTYSFLRKIERDIGLVRKELKNRMPPPVESNSIGQLPRSRTSTQVLEHANFEALASGSDLSSPSHLILGLLRVHGTVAHATLEHFGLQIDEIRTDIKKQPDKD